MTSYQYRWLLLISTGLLALSGASCPQMVQQYTNPPPRVLPPSPTLEQVLEVVNRNSRQIQSFSTNQASISGRGFPSLRASMAFQRPQRFRLRADSIMGNELDLGSNDELFWFYVRRNQPPAMYFCRHEQFAASAARQMTPFEPAWLVEALGVAEFDPALPHQLSSLPNDKLRIDTVRNTPEGPVTKITILDGSQGYILEQHFYDARRQRIASAVASRHRSDPATNLVMPMAVHINCPLAQLDMQIELGNVQINRLSAEATALWTPPSYPEAPPVDMGNPNFQPPLPPPATARAAGRESPPADRRPPPGFSGR